MADNAVPTLVPNSPTQDVLQSLSPSQAPALDPEKEALFDSIADDAPEVSTDDSGSTFKAVFAGFLWFGYAVAIVVALVLVWSAANGLLISTSH